MKPLAERMRPQVIDDYIGQKHLVGKDGVIQQMISSQRLTSFILWGPPGVGKTTLAQIVANSVNVPFYTLSAVNAGVKDVREIIEKAKKNHFFNTKTPILFIDEIHRFSKSQQDSLLSAVEKGDITLIGATTENPSFEIISPLLSRCQVYILEHLSKDDMYNLLSLAIKKDTELKEKTILLTEVDALFFYSAGDARKLLNIFELLINTIEKKEGLEKNIIELTNKKVKDFLLSNPLSYDKKGEMHYDIVSAFIKSIRGSDPDASIYWLARMIEGGEDPLFIARRVVISAAEDIGLANPNALLLANTALDAVSKIGWPEARIILAEVVIYLANSPKSNSSYLAINKALNIVKETGNKEVPLHLRNAPTQLMKELNYGTDYIYPHDYPEHFMEQSYLPKDIEHYSFWKPADNSAEEKQKQWLNHLWRFKKY